MYQSSIYYKAAHTAAAGRSSTSLRTRRLLHLPEIAWNKQHQKAWFLRDFVRLLERKRAELYYSELLSIPAGT